MLSCRGVILKIIGVPPGAFKVSQSPQFSEGLHLVNKMSTKDIDTHGDQGVNTLAKISSLSRVSEL